MDLIQYYVALTVTVFLAAYMPFLVLGEILCALEGFVTRKRSEGFKKLYKKFMLKYFPVSEDSSYYTTFRCGLVIDTCVGALVAAISTFLSAILALAAAVYLGDNISENPGLTFGYVYKTTVIDVAEWWTPFIFYTTALVIATFGSRKIFDTFFSIKEKVDRL